MEKEEIINKVNLAKSYIGKYKRMILSINTANGGYISFINYEDKDRFDVTRLEVLDDSIKYNSYFDSSFVPFYNEEDKCYYLSYENIYSIQVLRYNK